MSERDGSERDGRSESGDERLAGRAKALFDDSVRELDAATLSKLNRGRQRALAETRANGTTARWSRWMPVAAAAVAAAAVVVFWWPGTGDGLPRATPSDVEILLAEEELEMLEDLEFYRWMALVESEEEDGAGDEVG